MKLYTCDLVGGVVIVIADSAEDASAKSAKKASQTSPYSPIEAWMFDEHEINDDLVIVTSDNTSN
jgi:hypothetical protein